MEHAARRRQAGPLEGLYRLIMRRNSIYVTFVIAGAFAGERVVDYGVRKLWESNNVGEEFCNFYVQNAVAVLPHANILFFSELFIITNGMRIFQFWGKDNRKNNVLIVACLQCEPGDIWR
ncbi:hypothetical protein Tsubulata_000494 [Turnera subulata]|uniref:Complex III subunit 9 n=1 Tax=Turnera subulata TaxID=218843 RepID=A0A9Q0GMD5_9ROSI|nr:hypothetical protein Tsubulata_000494 [Turnera subulata]